MRLLTTILLSSARATAAPSLHTLMTRQNLCYFDGPSAPVGSGNANCAGSNGKAHEDVLTCPNQGVADRICSHDGVDPTARDYCQAIVGTASYCTVGGPVPKGGHHICYCVSGSFCCSQGAEVPGIIRQLLL
ncbi:uncharacterized protein BDW43DRAFT_306745 [Aspergillus alliaceus]|uniref:uncharacterized protein n=1 Tax=Petromyces alliaceus TaxID=209559 RepID=UPI0012A3B5B6|nr:uncharacterized protein BDW43DRAFT_306745 [Aspergillus alliaceus]KAB8238046.1 hypothetical protein BDW43DRAFT_306745 [Aspergillus alliaceus]